MVEDEAEKRQPVRLAEAVPVSDSLIIDTVSTVFCLYLFSKDQNRYFLLCKEWERFIVPRGDFEQKRLWEIPMSLSVNALRAALAPLCERQPALRLIFHLP